MPPRPYILNELTWKTVRDTRYEVAVLPWGATEAHNLHLPYSTDNIETERIAALAARHASEHGARVVVLHRGEVRAVGAAAQLLGETRTPTMRAAFETLVQDREAA